MAEIVAASAMTEAGVSKRVALKRIRTASSGDPQFVARFFDEVRLAMQLSHANVVQVFDFGRTETHEFFLAMEFVEGVDLQRLRRRRDSDRLPPAEALHVVAQMLRGLDYAHRRTDSDNRPLGIVHLDVKPANVLVSFEGEVKLTDFGVARSRDVRRPTVGISGTIPFMSPEQTRGEPVDLRSDVFSAGVRAVRAARGRVPVRRGGHGRDAVRDPALPLSPAGRAGTAPSCFEPLLRRALALAPRDRFPSAGAFADAIDELMFAQGWRGGAGALRDRLRAAFPHERDAPERAVRSRQAARGPRGHARREPARGHGAVACRGGRPAAQPRRATDGGRGGAARARTARARRARQSASPRWWPPARDCWSRPRAAPVVAPAPTHESEPAAPTAPAHADATRHGHAHARRRRPPPSPPAPTDARPPRDGHDLRQRQPVGHRPRQRQARRHDADPPFPGARRARVGDNREPEAGAKAGRREDRAEEGHAADCRPAHRRRDRDERRRQTSRPTRPRGRSPGPRTLACPRCASRCSRGPTRERP